jgi:hypothetical protein
VLGPGSAAPPHVPSEGTTGGVAAVHVGQTVIIRDRPFTVTELLRTSHDRVSVRADDELGRPRVVRFLPSVAPAEMRALLARAARVETSPGLATVWDGGSVRLDAAVVSCLVEEWVEGETLAGILGTRSHDVTGAFLSACMADVSAAVADLRANGLVHGRLDPSNIVLWRPRSSAPGDGSRFRLVDMSGLGDLSPPDDADGRALLDLLVRLHNTAAGNTPLPAREIRFLGLLRTTVLPRLLDDDPTVGLRDPTAIAAEVESARQKAARATRPDAAPSLMSPFDYISAEHISDDRLLLRLFAKSCPWLEEVARPDPCLVIGPRGCGKSMLFRWLSLKTQLAGSGAALPDHGLAAFYVSCSSDLQNRLGWVRDDATAEKHRSEIVHYFNLLVAREAVETLALIAARPDRQEAFGFGLAEERAVHEFVLGAIRPGSTALAGAGRLPQAAELIEAEMRRTHEAMRAGTRLPWTTAETFLSDLSRLLTRRVAYFSDRRITYLVDDYSTHRIPLAVQHVLNRVIWERTSSHIFKLSSEKRGTEVLDDAGATADQGREFVIVDCGATFINLDDGPARQRARAFARDLLAQRLEAAGYAGTPETLIGDSDWGGRSLSVALTDKGPGRRNDQYHGLQCIADLCSGDVANLLLVYRRLLQDVAPDSTSRIPPARQHAAIQAVSRELVDAIRSWHPHGQRMHLIATSFGTLVQRVMKEGRPHKDPHGRRTIPTLAPRIEVDQSGGGIEGVLRDDETDVLTELIRRAVFIELNAGRSRREGVQTLRLQLRRIYLPSFGAALAKNDAFKWRPTEFRDFLADPVTTAEKVWRAWPRADEGDTLFDEAGSTGGGGEG